MKYRNPRYIDDNHIDCEVEHPEYGWVPFTCNPNDTGAAFNTAALFEEMKLYALPYDPPLPPSFEELAETARVERNLLLSASDWTQLLDARTAMGGETAARWDEYRQELRDVPQQEGFPTTIVWPTSPA
jgi:hypothetical protein